MNQSDFKTLSIDEDTLESYTAIAANKDAYRNYDTNITLRTGFSRKDYEFFRPNEALPNFDIEKIKVCNNGYRRVGIVRNVIDLMGDFGSQGVNLVHPDPRIQDFYQGWFKSVKGKERSERFLNLLYRMGNVVVRRYEGRLPVRMANRFRQTLARDQIKEIKQPKNIIPTSYYFYNPIQLKVLNKSSVCNTRATPILAINIPLKVRQKIQYPRSQEDINLVKNLPKEIVRAVKNGQSVLKLDQKTLSVHYYKKDDWDLWADPLIFAIIDDVQRYEKTKLADLAALDGAISQVRLWTLGSLEHKIFPNQAIVDKLVDQLTANVGGGTMDLVWGPELTFKESTTDLHKFLGEEKYKPVVNDLHNGLGIPSGLTGGSGGKEGASNNSMSLKTLIERLNYGRDVLSCFWESEAERVRVAMGFKVAATVRYDRMVLTDESAEKALLVQLADRNLISDQTLQERFGENPKIENSRINNEALEVEKGIRQDQGGPWMDPEKDFSFKKIALQNGSVAPEDVGLESSVPVEPIQRDSNNPQEKNKGQPQQGRPINSKDKQKRQKRTFKPIGATLLWASATQRKISKETIPAYLKFKKKKNVRSLTKAEFDELEWFNFAILLSLNPNEKFNLASTIASHPIVPKNIEILYNNIIEDSFTIEDKRNLMVYIYTLGVHDIMENHK